MKKTNKREEEKIVGKEEIFPIGPSELNVNRTPTLPTSSLSRLAAREEKWIPRHTPLGHGPVHNSAQPAAPKRAALAE